MARVLAISSYVAHGHVGLGALVPVLQRLGHQVMAMPTVLLSNHPKHPHCAGEPVAPELLRELLDSLDSNGWLRATDAVLTGYLPTLAHVRFAASAAARVSERQAQAQFFCDPVIGDDPDGLYVREDAAAAIRDELAPLADMLFPNRFELAWLSRQEVRDAASAVEAARELRAQSILATSVPCGPRLLGNVLMDRGEATVAIVDERAGVPHGTGDMLSALYLGQQLKGRKSVVALGSAVAGVEIAIGASRGSTDLKIIETQDRWVDPIPHRVDEL